MVLFMTISMSKLSDVTAKAKYGMGIQLLPVLLKGDC